MFFPEQGTDMAQRLKLVESQRWEAFPSGSRSNLANPTPTFPRTQVQISYQRPGPGSRQPFEVLWWMHRKLRPLIDQLGAHPVTRAVSPHRHSDLYQNPQVQSFLRYSQSDNDQPKEKGTNADVSWTNSPSGTGDSISPFATSHRSGQKVSGKGEKLLASRWMARKLTLAVLPSGM